ncbi:MAG: hypothetical protein K0R38_5484 [Polyangiaceae bacterium]|jgi:hypothetical protein|nr:hypothetical protein [Polyangiaceae bacterium]
MTVRADKTSMHERITRRIDRSMSAIVSTMIANRVRVKANAHNQKLW